MNGTATPTQDQPAPPPRDDLQPPATGTPRIIGGVAAALADGLGIDALWVRISFVLLAMVGGLGLVVYGAMWLLLVAGPARGSRPLVIAGGAILVGGLPILLGGFSFDSPFVLFVVLAGLALALWQPRTSVTEPRLVSHAPADGSTVGSRAEAMRQRLRLPARRDPSPLGAITLGVAMVVAAAIALVDQANGGRLHPEVWHGAAAVVCGIGLLVGTVRGHARWLIVPAVVLAGMGVVAGEMAQLDIEARNWTGDRGAWVDADTTGPISLRTGLGSVHITISEAPSTPLEIDARVAVGSISIDTNDDVAVDVQRDDRPPERIGREIGPADVVVQTRVGIGNVDLGEWQEAVPLEEAPIPGRPDGVGALNPVAEQVDVTDDGWFVLAMGEAVLDDQNRVAYGDADDGVDGVTRVFTSYGEFVVLPRGLLLTPDQQVIDLDAVRARQVEPETDTTVPETLVDPQGDLP